MSSSMGSYVGSNEIAFSERTISRNPLFLNVTFPIPSTGKLLGASSLEGSAIRTASQCIEDLSSDVLRCVPRHLGVKIYQQALAESLERFWPPYFMETIGHGKLRFDVWKSFVTVYAQDGRFSDAEAIITDYGAFSLPTGMRNGTAWLTQLSVHTSLLNHQDMFELSKIPSLAILLLNNKYHPERGMGSEVDDRVIRNWARSTEENGFPNLRIISFHGYEYLSPECLKHLRRFPALKFLYFDGCRRIDKEAYDAGKISTADFSGWERYHVNLEDRLNFVGSMIAYGSSLNGKFCQVIHPPDFWTRWHAKNLRKLQTEETRPDPSGKDQGQDLKKPILSLVYGTLPPVTDVPLVLRRTTIPDVRRSTPDVKDEDSSVQRNAKSTSRQIKRQKLDSGEDFMAMLSGK